MIATNRFFLIAIAIAIMTESPVQADELPPTRYLWNASGQTGSFIYDINAPVNPIFELTWDQASTTHSGEAIQYNVTRDITGTQIVFTGGQIGQGFFSIQMQHPDSNLPSIPNTFDFAPPNDIGLGWIGGQLITSNSSFPIDSILDDGFASLPPNDDPVLTAARINGFDSDLVIDESGATTNLTLDAFATDVQAGVLYFTIDGVGPTPAANTGANSLRSSHSVNRSVSGDDSNGSPAASYDITVIDSRGAEATITRNVYVQNVAPTVTSHTLNGAAGDLVFDEGAGFMLSGAMQATDPGADAITFTIGGEDAGAGGSVPGSTRSSGTATVSFTGQSGVYPVAFDATDDDETTTATRNVTVNNLPPSITSFQLNGAEEDLVVPEGAPFDVLARMAATDAGPDELIFMIDNQSAGFGGATPGSNRESLELALQFDGQDGAYPILFAALDDETQVDTTRTITVENVAPTVTGITFSKTVFNEGESITASMTATDPGPDALEMSIFNIPAGIGGDAPGSVRTSDTITIGPLSQRNGSSDDYDVSARVTDDGAVAGELTETITVLNLPPQIVDITPDTVVSPGESINFNAFATDPGFDLLSYSWDTDDDGVYDTFGRSPVFGAPHTFTAPDVGVYTIDLLVEDGDGGEAIATISVISVQLAGDYNQDGVVDAADYTVWRDNEGMTAGTLINDPNQGVIGQAQYDTWVANFGSTLLGVVTVPEPAGAVLLLALALAGAPSDRRTR